MSIKSKFITGAAAVTATALTFGVHAVGDKVYKAFVYENSPEYRQHWNGLVDASHYALLAREVTTWHAGGEKYPMKMILPEDCPDPYKSGMLVYTNKKTHKILLSIPVKLQGIDAPVLEGCLNEHAKPPAPPVNARLDSRVGTKTTWGSSAAVAALLTFVVPFGAGRLRRLFKPGALQAS